jgi:hypothetical protein
MYRIIRFSLLLTLALALFAAKTESKGNGLSKPTPLASRLVVFETFMRPG